MLSLGLGLSLTNSGTAAEFPTSLFAGSAAGGWYDPSDLSTMFQDTAGTTPITADGQSVARINDKSGNGNHLTQGTAANRPLYKTSGGLHWLQFDGTNDGLASAAGRSWPVSTDVFCALGNPLDDTFFPWLYSGSDELLATVQSGSGATADANAGTPTYAVNGTVGGQLRGELYVAIGTTPKVLEARGATLSSWDDIKLCDYSTVESGINIYGLIICPANVDRAGTLTWLGAKAGLTL